MKRRIFGLENEYGLTCTLNGERRLSPRHTAQSCAVPLLAHPMYRLTPRLTPRGMTGKAVLVTCVTHPGHEDL